MRDERWKMKDERWSKRIGRKCVACSFTPRIQNPKPAPKSNAKPSTKHQASSIKHGEKGEMADNHETSGTRAEWDEDAQRHEEDHDGEEVEEYDPTAHAQTGTKRPREVLSSEQNVAEEKSNGGSQDATQNVSRFTSRKTTTTTGAGGGGGETTSTQGEEEGQPPNKKKMIQCFNCGGMGHYRTLCPSVPGMMGGPECYVCGGKGHIQSRCPNKLPPNHCYTCGFVGHRAKECPNAAPFSSSHPPFSQGGMGLGMGMGRGGMGMGWEMEEEEEEQEGE